MRDSLEQELPQGWSDWPEPMQTKGLRFQGPDFGCLVGWGRRLGARAAKRWLAIGSTELTRWCVGYGIDAECSNSLNDDGWRHAAAGAHGDQASVEVPALQFIQHGTDED